MRYNTEEYIDWFIETNSGNYRSAMAWLIGRMNAVENTLRDIYEVTNHPKAEDETTIEYIERELDNKEQNDSGREA